jgi:uncharacterized integral membrane protein (TIGR00697 family)
MNEVVTILSFVILATLVVTASRLGTTSLFVLSVTFILLSNITIGIPIRVFGIEFPWALIVYSLVYFITNLVCEFRGKTTAYQLAITNVTVQIVFWGYIWASLALTPVENAKGVFTAMNLLLGATPQVSVAALLASVGPFVGIFMYSQLRKKWQTLALKYEGNSTPTGRVVKEKMLAIIVINKLSTFIGQIVNTVVFFAVADLNWHTDISALTHVVMSSVAVKIVIAIADVPFLILAIKFLSLRESSRSKGAIVSG